MQTVRVVVLVIDVDDNGGILEIVVVFFSSHEVFGSIDGKKLPDGEV